MDRSAPNLATIRETARKYPFLSEATLRDKVYHSRERLVRQRRDIPPNGFARCIVKLGRQILIDLDQLDALIEEHRAAPIPENPRAAA